MTPDGCKHCPDGHDDPRTKSWGVFVAPDWDGDGQPTHLHVGPSNGSHVAESDAAWLACLINGADPTHCPNSPGPCMACGRNPARDAVRTALIQARAAIADKAVALLDAAPEHVNTLNLVLRAADDAIGKLTPPGQEHRCRPGGQQTPRMQAVNDLLLLAPTPEVDAQIARVLRHLRTAGLCATCGYRLDGSDTQPESV